MPSLVRVQPNALLSHRLLSNVQSPLQRGETCCSPGCAPAEFSAVTYRLPFQRPLCSPHVHLALHSGWLSTPGRDSGRLGRARCAKMAPSPRLPSHLPPDCLFPYRRKTAFSPGPGDEDSCSWNVLIIFKKGKHNGDTVEVAVMRFLPIE